MIKKMNKMFDEIVMEEERKEWIWEDLEKTYAKPRVSSMRRGIVAAACLLALVIPIGVIAASGFQWPFLQERGEEENKQLNSKFHNEQAQVNAYGLQFKIEKALCDKSMNIGYFYVSVKDLSGNGIHVSHAGGMEETKQYKKGDIIFDFLYGGVTYDEENSTEGIQYFYVENELSAEDTDPIQNLRIEIGKFEGNGKQGEVYTEILKTETLTAANVVEMPTLTWKIGAAEVKLSSIAANVSDKKTKELQIILKNNKTITDYFDYNLDKIGKDGTIPEDSFTTKEEQKPEDSADTTVMAYRFGYVDISRIEGIRYDGRYYGAEETE